MLVNILVVVIALVFPWVANRLADKFSFFEKLGPIVICYLFGFFLGNVGVPYDPKTLTTITEIVVPLSIPLFIFGVDFIGWLKSGRDIALSFLLVIMSVTVMTLIAGAFFHETVPGADKIAGMLAGVYTGGTPNLSAIGKALEVAEETIVLVNGVDMATGSIYLAVLLFFGNRFLSGFLRVKEVSKEEQIDHCEEGKSFKDLWKGASIGLLLSLLILGISFGLNTLFFDALNVAFLISSISLLAGAASFSSKARSLEGPYELGHYLLMIFCVGIGGLANVKELMNLSFDVALMCSFVIFGAIVMHLLLAKLFKIDRDSAIITSVAGIYGPPFVPLIADRFQNKAMIAPGIATGLVGFALGNYLGIGIYFLLQGIF